MKLIIQDDSKNYTAQIVKLHSVQKLDGLDNLVGANIQGNLALISKDYAVGELYVYFPAGTVLNTDFLSKNNLFRENTYNADTTKVGFFEPSCRCKAVKFRGNKSTALLCPLSYLSNIGIPVDELKEGDEFNQIDALTLCVKYVVPIKGLPGSPKQKGKLLDNIVDKVHFKENIDSCHLLKYIDKLNLNKFTLTVKLHGTSGRTAHTIVRRKLSILERIAKFFGAKVETERYEYVCGSHHVVKSVGFNELKGKNHFYKADLWTAVGEEYFKGRLNKGEAVYYEIVGKTYEGGDIQKNYSYGFTKPEVFIYRISNINPDGIEIDLTHNQMVARANELGLKTVPLIFQGAIDEFFDKIRWEKYHHTDMCFNDIWEDWENKKMDYFAEILKEQYLEKPSMFDKKVVEEGIVLSLERYPVPQHFKLKSPSFIIHESSCADKGIPDVEDNS